MDCYYAAGKTNALEKLGVADRQLELAFDDPAKGVGGLDIGPRMRNLVRTHPRHVAGGLIGGALAVRTLTSNKEPKPRMEPPIIEGNPLTSNIHR